MKDSALLRRMLLQIEARPDGLDLPQIAAAVGLPIADTERAVRLLVRAGRLKRRHEGPGHLRYACAAPHTRQASAAAPRPAPAVAAHTLTARVLEVLSRQRARTARRRSRSAGRAAGRCALGVAGFRHPVHAGAARPSAPGAGAGRPGALCAAGLVARCRGAAAPARPHRRWLPAGDPARARGPAVPEGMDADARCRTAQRGDGVPAPASRLAARTRRHPAAAASPRGLRGCEMTASQARHGWPVRESCTPLHDLREALSGPAEQLRRRGPSGQAPAPALLPQRLRRRA